MLGRMLPLPILMLLALSACGGGSADGERQDEYPIVAPAPVETQPPVTTAGGAVVTRPALPTAYEVEPSPTCEREPATFRDGSQRLIVIPPAPGLRAVAVTEHTTRVEWSFQELPDDCAPVELLLSVDNDTEALATPTVVRGVEVDGLSGERGITYPDFLPAPNVARASAYLRDGRPSRVVSVLIERPANTPPDPPEALPPVTAPAGAPAGCSGPTTTVEDPSGDVLTHNVGKPPTQVRSMTPALSRIDLTRVAVQIDGRKICATFTFAGAPKDEDFGLYFHLQDTTEPSCCASLRFRRTAGRLEIGAHSTDASGTYRLDPVPAGGARLRGATLTISGTLPSPDSWQMRARRMPAVEDLAWSIVSTYYPNKYGPYFGDWLPPHQPVGQPAIRHRDGVTVRPGG